MACSHRLVLKNPRVAVVVMPNGFILPDDDEADGVEQFVDLRNEDNCGCTWRTAEGRQRCNEDNTIFISNLSISCLYLSLSFLFHAGDSLLY